MSRRVLEATVESRRGRSEIAEVNVGLHHFVIPNMHSYIERRHLGGPVYRRSSIGRRHLGVPVYRRPYIVRRDLQARISVLNMPSSLYSVTLFGRPYMNIGWQPRFWGEQAMEKGNGGHLHSYYYNKMNCSTRSASLATPNTQSLLRTTKRHSHVPKQTPLGLTI